MANMERNNSLARPAATADLRMDPPERFDVGFERSCRKILQ
jgi:hypothetical protein